MSSRAYNFLERMMGSEYGLCYHIVCSNFLITRKKVVFFVLFMLERGLSFDNDYRKIADRICVEESFELVNKLDIISYHGGIPSTLTHPMRIYKKTGEVDFLVNIFRVKSDYEIADKRVARLQEMVRNVCIFIQVWGNIHIREVQDIVFSFLKFEV